MSFPTQTILLLYEPKLKIIVHLQVLSCHLSRSNSPHSWYSGFSWSCAPVLTAHKNLPSPNPSPSTLTPHQTSKPLFGLREQNRDSSISLFANIVLYFPKHFCLHSLLQNNQTSECLQKSSPAAKSFKLVWVSVKLINGTCRAPAGKGYCSFLLCRVITGPYNAMTANLC